MRNKWLAGAVAACLLLVGCARDAVVTPQADQVEITLSWWGNDARTEYTIAGVQEFERLHPDIRVKMNYSEWSGYESRNRIQMASVTEADVMQINFNWLPEFSPDGEGYYDIEELTDYVDLSQFSQELLDYGRRGGVLNAVPIAMNTETLYMDKTVYDSYGLPIPETWEEFLKAAEVMRKDGVYPLAGPSKSIWLYTIAYAEQATGNHFLREDGKLNFTMNELRIMIEFYKQMTEAGVFPQVEFYDRLCIDNRTYAGGIAWVSDAKNYYGGLVEAGDELVIAPYTHDADHTAGDGWYAKPASLYAISKHTQHPKESAMLLDFLLNSPKMAVLQGVEKGVPISPAAREALDQNGQLAGLQYEAALCMEGTDGMSKMNSMIENAALIDNFFAACNLYLYGKATAEEAAGQFYMDIRNAEK